MIIGLVGMSRHGKDTVGASFVRNGFKRYAFADKAKEAFCELKGITLEYLEKNKSELRSELIDFAESKKKDDKYYWIKAVEKDLEADISKDVNIIITDVRQIEEIYTLIQLRKILDGYTPLMIFEVIRPLENGGTFDMDKNTSAGIQYAHYHRAIDGVILNNSSFEKLVERTDEMARSMTTQ